MPPQALDDLLVLDLTHYVAGPYCTKRLADFGARVIKIEPPLHGDPGRQLGPFPNNRPHPEKSGLFLHLNTNKESVTLNLKRLRGRQLFVKLLEYADIVVENFRPGVMRNLQLDYPLLRRVKPNVVMTSISNFGQSGPYRDWRAQDLTLYAMGGEMYSSGATDRDPLKQAPELTLFQGGSVAATATMIGVFSARRHHIGQHLDISLFETQAGSIDRRLTSLVAYQYNGASPGPEDPIPVGIMPSGVYPCQDGFVDMRVNFRWWDRLVAMMDMPELHEDPRFNTDEARFNPANREAFLTLFETWLRRHTRQEVMRKAQQFRIPGTAINLPGEVIEDPHFTERGAFVAVDHPVAGRWRLPGAPFRPQRTPWRALRPAPLLGQHTAAVLQEFAHLDATEIEALQQANVI
jgi:crotonobetainyl-CoA:carnitine CoA-transferase CaiB-like acyl-CoA transferase